jgi:hypothetical protein
MATHRKKSFRLISLTAVLGVFLLGNKVAADDGGISFGGSPHLLNGHPSVAMVREAVHIDVHKEVITVDCNFVFHNSGPVCTVRMGFPDEGLGAAEPYQGDPVPTGPDLKATFLSYDSYVDGKKVPTKLVPTNDRTLYWHTKNVTFKPNSDCIIRDVYTLKPGGQVTSGNGLYQQTSYVLHTGASWHGPIGKADITIKFEPDTESVPIKLQALSALHEHDLSRLDWAKLPAGTVVYEGPCAAKAQGQTMSFTKTNFTPTKKDDIRVYYAYRSLTNGQ